MGSVNLDNTGSGSAITLSSDGTSLLLDGTAVGGGGDPALYRDNASGATTPSATGSGSVAIGGSARAYSTDSLAIGLQSYASGTKATALGYASSASGTGSIAIGNSTATAFLGSSFGEYALSESQGKYSYASGRFGSTEGSAQTGTYVLRADTTDATPEGLTTRNNGGVQSDNQVNLPNNSAYAFSGTIVGRESAASGTECAAWKVEGLIRREGSASTTVLVNSATTVLNNAPSWGMALSADTTNGALQITVTGAAKTIRWVGAITTTELIHA
tara:strand:- start:1133 stop:1951 length:819 start_codon:yes stop_codon:yes gene_type:complete